MRAQLIIDCSGRVLTALLLTPDGQIVPVSQEIRNVAARHVSMDVLFDPRVPEHPDFLWDDALESLGKARARDFFHRARRVGLRRPWDTDASSDLLRLASPLAVLSSATALADRVASDALPRFSLALLDALLEPAFAFVTDRKLTPADVDPILVVPPQTGHTAWNGIQKLVRRRGFRRATLVRREVAAALGLLGQSCNECVVIDATDDDLRIHRLSFGAASGRSVRTVRSSTLRGLGWSHWVSRIAAALGMNASPLLDRTLLALLTGSPESLPTTLIHAALNTALDDTWIDGERRAWTTRLQEQWKAVAAGDARALLVGEIFALEAVRRVFDGESVHGGAIDLPARGLALGMIWLAAEPSRTVLLASGGSLRLDTLHGDAIELLAPAQVPAAGEMCHVERTFRFAGEPAGDNAFLVHLLWGTDLVPEGNATLAAVPLELQGHGDGELHVSIHLRRSRNGALLSGNAQVRAGRNAVTAQFTHELEVRR